MSCFIERDFFQLANISEINLHSKKLCDFTGIFDNNM